MDARKVADDVHDIAIALNFTQVRVLSVLLRLGILSSEQVQEVYSHIVGKGVEFKEE